VLKPGEIRVWRIHLDEITPPAPTPGEQSRAARFATPELRRRYLAAHGALRSILAQFTSGRLDFALHDHGKPYLPNVPQLQFNLSHSRELAVVAVALDIPVGVDIERVRPLAQHAAIAERFLPPNERQPVDEIDFFRRWTRYEAVLKAQGVGLYGAGVEIDGEWVVQEFDPAPGFVAAVAAAGTELQFLMHDYGETT
jgi:4'-phosphopantetheinyl transferase